MRFHVGSPGNLHWAIRGCSFKLETISYTSNPSTSMCRHPRGWHEPLDLVFKGSQALPAQEKSESALPPMYSWHGFTVLSRTTLWSSLLWDRSESGFKSQLFTGVLRRHEKNISKNTLNMWRRWGWKNRGHLWNQRESWCKLPFPLNTSQYLNLLNTSEPAGPNYSHTSLVQSALPRRTVHLSQLGTSHPQLCNHPVTTIPNSTTTLPQKETKPRSSGIKFLKVWLFLGGKWGLGGRGRQTQIPGWKASYIWHSIQFSFGLPTD